MTVSFTNTTGVFLFIIFCSVYVCSILWIYGDAATRDMGHKGLILPFLFIAIGTLALIREGWFLVLLLWPLGYLLWFIKRPKKSHAIVE